MADYYEICGVQPNATAAELKRAYRKQVARYHPDKHEGNELQELAAEKLAALNEAYAVLSDPRKRAAYDASLRRGGPGASPFGYGPRPRPGFGPSGDMAPPAALRPILGILTVAGLFLAFRLLRNPKTFAIVAGVTATVWIGAVIWRKRRKRRRR